MLQKSYVPEEVVPEVFSELFSVWWLFYSVLDKCEACPIAVYPIPFKSNLKSRLKFKYISLIPMIGNLDLLVQMLLGA